MTKLAATSQDALRRYILASGGDDWVSLAAVLGRISRDQLADSLADSQRLVVTTVRSLLAEKLIEIGEIPGRSDPGFMPWPGDLDGVMKQFTDRFIERHDDRLGWEYTIWLNLTSEGEQVSAQIPST